MSDGDPDGRMRDAGKKQDGEGEAEEELALLFTEDIPDKLTDAMLALAHLSDVEEEESKSMDEEEELSHGPMRRRRTKKISKPYKTVDDEFRDEMKELEFRTNAWKPFKGDKK